MTKKLNIIKRLTMPIPEYERYYRELRKEQFESNKLFKGIGIRKILHMIPQEIVVLDELPLTSIGKVDFKILEEMAENLNK